MPINTPDPIPEPDPSRNNQLKLFDERWDTTDVPYVCPVGMMKFRSVVG